ncbi:Nrap protein [Russula earlei]|uniref:Nrap protein n=1 Tax=Russula earlei TaxID=71964 RepID=A0ACC0U0V2_9AGAM|nr:Nrap protein [Russula earlei]
MSGLPIKSSDMAFLSDNCHMSAVAGVSSTVRTTVEGGIEDSSQAYALGNGVNKPPSGMEITAIRAAQDLFMSGSFKLQIDALLPNVRPKHSRKPSLDKFLFSLHACLSSLPPVEPRHPLAASRALSEGSLISDASEMEQGVRVDGKITPLQTISVPYPLPAPTEDANWKVSFEKPENIAIVGSWINNVAVKRSDDEPWVIDVAVEMPPASVRQSLFQEKDYMNSRFFHKRAFYLAIIAKHISDPTSELGVDVYYESKGGDPRLTTLILRPVHDKTRTGLSTLDAVVRIIPTLSTTSPIRRTRLSPTRSNFRVHRLDSTESGHENVPTPIYNAVLMLAFAPQLHVLSVNALKDDVPAYRDALSLLRVWANQRGYGEGRRTCIWGFEAAGPWWNAVLELLVRGEEPCSKTKSRRRPLGNGLSSYQLFRAALDLLSQHDFSQDPIFVKSEDDHLFSPEDYLGRYEAVLVDSSCINVLAGVSVTSIEMLKQDARATLEVLDRNTPAEDAFTDVFLTDHRDLMSRFDLVLLVDLSSATPRRLFVHDILESGSSSSALLASLSRRLRDALGSRVKALSILHPPTQLRAISRALPTGPSTVFIGLLYDQEHAFKIVDHGPVATEAPSRTTEAFRELWGNKAEVRRFQDGSITESVVWDVRHSDERRHIPAMIVRHILALHFGMREDAMVSWQSGFDAILRRPPSMTSNCRGSGFKAAITAFQKLTSSIKALGKELPLAIVNVSPVSPELRYTSVFAPISVPTGVVSNLPVCSRYVPLIFLNLEFEKSARWPDDLAAIQKLKIAFLERIAQALANAIPDLHARVAVILPAGVPPTADHVQLEITTPDGWAFALRIWHDREATLLDRILHSSPATYPPHDLESARMAHRLYTRRFIAAPRHHRAVAALHHQFVAFSGTVRLVKRWLAAHWLLRLHVSEEAVEVLCAAVFAGVGSARVPNSRERGFACVIRLLRDWDWLEGIKIPLYGASDPGPDVYSSSVVGAKGVWALMTEPDPDGRLWTADAPDVVAARRIRALAHATHAYLQGVQSGVLDVPGMFVHPEEDYDFVVKLQPAVLPRYFQNVTTTPSILADKHAYTTPTHDEWPLRPGFDPVGTYLDDLTRIYADTAKFFYDPLGGDRFGGIWDPSLTKPMPFRVLNRFSSTPAPREREKSKDCDSVILNEGSVLGEIIRMGEGLVLT